MKGLPPALQKALKQASKTPSKAVYSHSGTLLNEKPHKYGAKRETCLYGHPHASRKEAMWCVKLHEMQKEGQIRDLKMQHIFDLDIGVTHICKHIVDFSYYQCFGGAMPLTVLEVKGMPTPEWKLKKKMFNALYPHINYVVV